MRCSLLLMQGLPPDIRELSEFYIFQQDSARPYRVRARGTVELLTADFIPATLRPPNSHPVN